MSNKRPVLGVDVDGVVGDYAAAMRKVVAAETGVDPGELVLPVTAWHLSDCWPAIRNREHFVELHSLGVTKHRMFRDMPMVEGAAEALWQLSDAGVYIRLITHRLFVGGGHALVAGDTAAALDAWNVPYRDLCFVEDKADVGASLYIEDAPPHIAALEESGARVLTFAHPYNEGIGSGPRSNSWQEIVGIVLSELGLKEPAPAV